MFCCFYSPWHLSILFSLVLSSVAIATPDVLLHFCLTLRLKKGRGGQSNELEVLGGVGAWGEEIRVEVRVSQHSWQTAVFWDWRHHVFLFVFSHCPSFSLCPFPPTPPSSHWPRCGSDSFGGPSLPCQRFVSRQIMQHTIVWERLHSCTCMHIARQVQHAHTQRHASLLSSPRAARHVLFLGQQIFL